MGVLNNAKLAFVSVHTYNPTHRNLTLAALRFAKALGLPDPTHARKARGLIHLDGLASSPGKVCRRRFLNKYQGAFE